MGRCYCRTSFKYLFVCPNLWCINICFSSSGTFLASLERFLHISNFSSLSVLWLADDWSREVNTEFWLVEVWLLCSDWLNCFVLGSIIKMRSLFVFSRNYIVCSEQINSARLTWSTQQSVSPAILTSTKKKIFKNLTRYVPSKQLHWRPSFLQFFVSDKCWIYCVMSIFKHHIQLSVSRIVSVSGNVKLVYAKHSSHDTVYVPWKHFFQHLQIFFSNKYFPSEDRSRYFL